MKLPGRYSLVFRANKTYFEFMSINETFTCCRLINKACQDHDQGSHRFAMEKCNHSFVKYLSALILDMYLHFQQKIAYIAMLEQ